MRSPLETLTGLREYARGPGVALHELTHPGGGVTVVVPAWGGRIVFAGCGEANVLWTAPDPAHPQLWPANTGGMRTWLSPEGGPKGAYFSADWKDWSCPAAMDPGAYLVEAGADADAIRMANEFTVTVNDGTEMHLQMGRDVAVGDRPGGLDGVEHLGIDFAHRLRNLGGALLDHAVDLWHLVQVVPGGCIVVPTADRPAWRNYFQPIPEERYEEHDDHLVVRIDGARRFKLGVPNTSATGAIGYLRARPDGTASAVVKRFEVSETAIHCDRPEGDLDRNGDVVQLYNHDTGGAEGFGEIECHSPSEALGPGEDQRYPIRIDVVEGSPDAVRAAAGRLLDRDLGGLTL